MNRSTYCYMKKKQGKMAPNPTFETEGQKRGYKKKMSKDTNSQMEEFYNLCHEGKEFNVEWYNGFVILSKTYNFNKTNYDQFVLDKAKENN